MSAFVVLCAVMAIAAIFFVAWPLLRPVTAERKDEPAPPKAVPLAFALSALIAVAGVALYVTTSSFPWSNPIAAERVPAGHGSAGAAGSMEDILRRLEARLAAQPDDREGWRMLGRTYLVTGDAGKAAQAYERAAALSPERDPALELDLAEALVLAEDPAQQPRAKAIIEAALKAEPGSQKALWYQSVIASREGDHETAKRNWLALLEQQPPPEIREIIAAQLKELGVDVPAAPAAAQPASAMGMGTPAAAASAPPAAVTARGRTLRINVRLDPAVADRVRPGVPLFVSAREPGIPGPPIAAVRLTTDQLSAGQVVLSDANTMIDGRDLSSIGDVEIVARVAFGGTSTVASGDLLGTAVQRKGADGPVDVVISRVQP